MSSFKHSQKSFFHRNNIELHNNGKIYRQLIILKVTVDLKAFSAISQNRLKSSEYLCESNKFLLSYV